MKIFMLVVFGILALIGLFAVLSAFYAVDQREYALQMRFGEVQQIREHPGLYVKAPFIDSIQRIDRRTLRADIPPVKFRTRTRNV